MVKNITGGNKAKKGKRVRLTKNPKKEFDTDNGIYFYGQVKGKLGGNTLEVLLQTGETIHATIPGRFMRRVWFNKDDLIVVSNETDNFYDVIQKITNPATQIEAMNALNIKLDKDDSQIFRADEEEFEQEDEEDEQPELSKAELNAMRKKKDKERDLQRRNGDNEDRVISVVTKNESTDSNESETESPTSSSSLKKNELSEDEEESEEELEDSSPIELPKPVETKRKNVPQVYIPEKKIPEKKETKETKQPEPVKKKVIHYRESVEETADMLGL